MWRAGAERRHRGVAAHEADQRPLDRTTQAEARGDQLVQARRGEPGAACHDQMGDRGRSASSASIAADREPGRVLLIGRMRSAVPGKSPRR